jgi:hypothetical protein
VIIVVVLQNGMDLLKAECGFSTETYGTSTLDRNQVTGTETERVTDIKEEEDQEARTIPVIKTEPKVSGVSVVSVCTFCISCTKNCVNVVQSVNMKQKFDSREGIWRSF